jgi:hypothetical protein
MDMAGNDLIGRLGDANEGTGKLIIGVADGFQQ